jgi:hypothetical protein
VSEERLNELEKRIAAIESELMHHRRLGPKPEDLTPDPAIVERLVESARVAIEEAKREEIPEADRSKRCMLSGNPETPEHREIDTRTGMQKDYVVLCPDERKKGFVRPVRRTYLHKTCGTTTTMGLALAETYARDPGFYGGTFCCHCRTHFPLDQFVWDGTDEQVGT